MRISEAFEKRPLLIVYICAGDPTPQATPELVRRLAAAGADIIELGLPHSDPVADGPTIQAAAQRAISAGMNTDLYFQAAAEANVVLVLFAKLLETALDGDDGAQCERAERLPVDVPA